MRVTPRRIVHLVFLAVALAWMFLAAAVVAGASHASGATNVPHLEQRNPTPRTSLDAVSKTVMCPTCDTTLDRSSSPAADRMRVWINAAVKAGWTGNEIRSGLVKEYGGDEAILASPRRHGIGAFAWYVPFGIVALLAVTGGVLVRRWRTSSSMSSPDVAESKTP